MDIQNSMTINLTRDEMNAAIIEGIQKKYKRAIPKGAKPAEIAVEFQTVSEAEGANVDVIGCKLTIPPVTMSVAPEAGEGSEA